MVKKEPSQGKSLVAYQKVEALREKNPGESVRDLIKMAKVTQSSYYYGAKLARKANGKALKPQKKHAVIDVPDANGMKMTVLMGTPEQIRQVLA